MTNWKRTLYIMFFAQLATAVGFSSIFPFLPLFVKSLGTNTNLSVELLAGMVFASQSVTMMVASPIWGSLADRYGRKLMVLRSMFGGALILLIMGFVRSAEELILLRAVQGFITGTVSAANALVAAETPRSHTGYAMGMLQVGLGAGVALGPVLGGVMADFYGYRAAFYLTAVLLLIAGILVWFGVEENFQAPPKQEGQRKGFSKWREILSTPGVPMTYNLRFMVLLGRAMIIPIAPLFIQTLLITAVSVNTFTGLVIGVAAATTTVSSIYFGKLGDRIGHRRVAITSTAIAALLYLPQSLVGEYWQLLALQALVGVAMGGVTPAISALLADYTKAGEAGAVYGLDNSVTSAAQGVAPLLGSAMALWFGLRSTFIATAIILFAAALLAALYLPKPAVRTQKAQREWSKTSQMDYK